MIVKQWTRFPGRPHGRYVADDISVTMSPRGVLYINERAWNMLGSPEAIEILYDKGRRLIGLEKSRPSVPEAFIVHEKRGTRGRQINASAFCSHFAIKMMRTGLFNEVHIDEDGIMTLALDTVSAVTRGAR